MQSVNDAKGPTYTTWSCASHAHALGGLKHPIEPVHGDSNTLKELGENVQNSFPYGSNDGAALGWLLHTQILCRVEVEVNRSQWN